MNTKTKLTLAISAATLLVVGGVAYAETNNLNMMNSYANNMTQMMNNADMGSMMNDPNMSKMMNNMMNDPNMTKMMNSLNTPEGKEMVQSCTKFMESYAPKTKTTPNSNTNSTKK